MIYKIYLYDIILYYDNLDNLNNGNSIKNSIIKSSKLSCEDDYSLIIILNKIEPINFSFDDTTRIINIRYPIKKKKLLKIAKNVHKKYIEETITYLINSYDILINNINSLIEQIKLPNTDKIVLNKMNTFIMGNFLDIKNDYKNLNTNTGIININHTKNYSKKEKDVWDLINKIDVSKFKSL